MTNFSELSMMQRLDYILKQRKMSATDLAEETNIDRSKIYSWRRLQRDFEMPYGLIIARHLGLSIDWLAFGTGPIYLQYDKSCSVRSLPLISDLQNFTESISFDSIADYIEVADAKGQFDFAYRLTTTALHPHYRYGDILLCSRDTSRSNIVLCISEVGDASVRIRDSVGQDTFYRAIDPIQPNLSAERSVAIAAVMCVVRDCHKI